jgi:hypothetical protein
VSAPPVKYMKAATTIPMITNSSKSKSAIPPSMTLGYPSSIAGNGLDHTADRTERIQILRE